MSFSSWLEAATKIHGKKQWCMNPVGILRSPLMIKKMGKLQLRRMNELSQNIQAINVTRSILMRESRGGFEWKMRRRCDNGNRNWSDMATNQRMLTATKTLM